MANQNAPLLEVRGLRTYFISKHETVKAVDGVSFVVNEQETFGLVGESGCGKSMTCRSILGLVKRPGRVVDGEILYKGEDLLRKSRKEMQALRGKELGMIFQEPMTALNPLLRVKDQIIDALDKTVYDTKEKQYNRALEMLKLVGIPAPEMRLEEYPHQFSGGMRQRVMIAIALCSGLKLLLADEPTTGDQADQPPAGPAEDERDPHHPRPGRCGPDVRPGGGHVRRADCGDGRHPHPLPHPPAPLYLRPDAVPARPRQHGQAAPHH